MYIKYLFMLLGTLSLNVPSYELNQDNLFDYLDSKKYLAANFIQITEIDSKERIITGSIKANRSGKFKIEYQEPLKEIISSDGKYLYRLDSELEQLYIIPQEDDFLNTPISILTLEMGYLKKLFLIDSCQTQQEETICTILPRGEDSFLEKIFLIFEQNSLTSIKYLDSFDQTVKIRLNDINWSPFDDSEITLSIPEGIDVVYH